MHGLGFRCFCENGFEKKTFKQATFFYINVDLFPYYIGVGQYLDK